MKFMSAAEMTAAKPRQAPGSVLLYCAGAMHREYSGSTIGWRSTEGRFFGDQNLAGMFERYGSMLEVRPEPEVKAEALDELAVSLDANPILSTAAGVAAKARARLIRMSPGQFVAMPVAA